MRENFRLYWLKQRVERTVLEDSMLLLIAVKVQIRSSISKLLTHQPIIMLVQTSEITMRVHPASDLDEIYALEGFAYKKKRSQVQRTIEALDYAEIYLAHRVKFPDINKLMEEIDRFLD